MKGGLAVVLMGCAAAAAEPARSAHDVFNILELKIGMPVEGNAGFTCAPAAGKDPQDRHCIKFLDSRCAGKKTSIGVLRYGQKAPLGCFFDHSSNATYLDDTLMQTPNTGDSSDKRPMRTPLMSLHLVGTRSKPSKIYRMSYLVAVDELTDDSKLAKALVAKYGEPTSKSPPDDMRWALENATLRAQCIAKQNCRIVAEDLKFEANERRAQEDADGQERRKNAADAPPL